MKEIFINVDTYNNATITIKQAENKNETYKIYLLKDNKRLDLTSKTAKMGYIMTGTTKGDIISLNITNPKNGEITLPITNSISKKDGVYSCQIAIYGTGDYLEFTATFSLIVQENIFSKIVHEVENSKDFTYLEGILKQAKDLADSLKTVTQQAKQTSTDLTTNLNKATPINKSLKDNIDKAENLNAKLEDNIGKAGEKIGSITELENNIKKAESLREEAEKKREKELADARLGADGEKYNTVGEAIRGQINKNIGIKSGSYTQALMESNKNNGIFLFLLKNKNFTKPIWHIGDNRFIDAVGAEIEEELDDRMIYNFTYKIKLSVPNETIYIPVDATSYEMNIDWGDGSGEEEFNKKASLGSCSHNYKGRTGDIFTITLWGENIPKLRFDIVSRKGQTSLYSIENNTLKNPLDLGVQGCPNLTRLCKNSFKNVPLTALELSNCVSLTEIEEGFSKNLQKNNIKKISFLKSPIKKLDDDFFSGINLTTCESIFNGTKLEKVPSSFKTAIRDCNNFYFSFANIVADNKLKIDNDLFSNVRSISDIRGCFNGGSAGTPLNADGDAEALYNSLKGKMSTTNYSNCFANNTLKNREKVPVAWGGTMK